MYYDHTVHMSHLGRSGMLLDPPFMSMSLFIPFDYPGGIELEVATAGSRQGKHSQHTEWVYIWVPTLHLGIFFTWTCRAQVLGHTRFCVFATVESCGPKHCAAVPLPKRRVKNQMRFAICDCGLRAAAKSDSDSEGLWVARNLAFIECRYSLPAQAPAESCLNFCDPDDREMSVFVIVFSTPYFT